MKKTLLILVIIIIPLISFGQEEGGERKNSLSVFIGGTTNSEASAFTIGLDYQYRIMKLIGVGAVIDYAAGDIGSTLVAPAAYLHLRRFEIVLAPGGEFSDGETSFVFRAGLGYEIEISRFKIVPSAIMDTERNRELSFVYGVAFGYSF